jgi:hypothetical protein
MLFEMWKTMLKSTVIVFGTLLTTHGWTCEPVLNRHWSDSCGSRRKWSGWADTTSHTDEHDGVGSLVPLSHSVLKLCCFCFCTNAAQFTFISLDFLSALHFLATLFAAPAPRKEGVEEILRVAARLRLLGRACSD